MKKLDYSKEQKEQILHKEGLSLDKPVVLAFGGSQGADQSDAGNAGSDEDHAQPDRWGQIDHPDHYGGKDNPYEAIKVIEAWSLNFNLGNTVKISNQCEN